MQNSTQHSTWPLRKAHFNDYLQLIRLNRPIGTLLLLYPALTALVMAAEGLPSIKNLVIFSLGTFLMRSAGCAINDYADRDWDGAVERTKNRPLAQHKISTKEALFITALMTFCAFLLVLLTNTATIMLSFVAAGLAALYPFTKRYTHLPQLFLGAAFAWSIPMAFAAQETAISSTTWLFFFATLAWTITYDTMYAMVDREDDLKVGIKSTAILFGQYDRAIIGLIQLFVLILLATIGHLNSYNVFYELALVVIFLLFVYQHLLIQHRDRANCFKAFLNNQWVGFTLLLGTLVSQMEFTLLTG